MLDICLNRLKNHLRRRGLLRGSEGRARYFEHFSPEVETAGQNLGEKCASVLATFLADELELTTYVAQCESGLEAEYATIPQVFPWMHIVSSQRTCLSQGL